MPPDPPSTSLAVDCYIRKLKNADQIYTYSMKMKLNKCIGLIAIVENFITKKYFHFVYKKNLV